MKKSLLIVDDSNVNRTVLSNIFIKDYRIFQAANGVEAFEKLDSHPEISLIILDIVMPIMDGYEFLKLLGSRDELKKYPVICKTAYSDHVAIHKVLELGAVDCIYSPFDPEIIRLRVANVLRGRDYLVKEYKEELEDINTVFENFSRNVSGGYAIYRVDKGKASIVSYNEALPRLSGYTMEEFKKMEERDAAERIYFEDRQSYHEALSESIESGNSISITYRLNHKDGSHPWVHLLGTKIKQSSGDTLFHAFLLDINESKQQEEKYKYYAEHDQLTGLYNSRTFYEKLPDFLASDRNQKWALLRFNIIKFRFINAMYGYEYGNTILLKISKALKKIVKEDGLLARLEADHFAMCIPEKFIGMYQISPFLDSFFNSYHIDYELRLTVGVYQIEDINTPANIMCDCAKLALNSIKNNYKRNLAYYNSRMKDTLLREEMFKSSLSKAMSKRQIKLYIQPKIDLSTETVMGGEVLVRWSHPEEGLIMPGEYIPVFEESGQIVDLDFYVCREAIKILKEWESKEIRLPLSVNLSRRTLAYKNSVEQILNLANKYSLDRRLLRLELTESAFVNNALSLTEDLKRLQSEGFQILIDDFGSGYSSFSMLKDAPVDCIKLDLQFLSGEDTFGRLNGIITSILHMCRKIKLMVIAEGVETKVQADLLKANGCKYAQGFYYSRPIPISEFEKMVQLNK